MKYKPLLLVIIAVALAAYLYLKDRNPQEFQTPKVESLISGSFDETKFRTEKDWKEVLTKDQYYILREKGTEIPFTGEFNNEKREGTYYSAGCMVPIFRSEQKFDSGTGWPSFTAPVSEDSLVLKKENGLDTRIEVLDKCGGHLGHVFDDGPPPTHKRYCINSDALIFVPDEN